MVAKRDWRFELAAAVLVGFLIGAFFQWVGLPVPVPHGWGGIAGVVGLFLGSKSVDLIRKRREKVNG